MNRSGDDGPGSSNDERTPSSEERARSVRDHQFRALVDAVEEYAIFRLGPAGTITSWNPGAERINGYPAEDILGEQFSTFYTAEDREAGVPEQNLAAAADHGSIEDEGWRVRADGSRFWANVTITAIHDGDGDLQGYAKVTRDMTERREYEQRLKEQAKRLERQRHDLEEELNEILERVDDAFYALDDEFRFEYVNDTAEGYLGKPAGELRGRNIWEALDVDEDDPIIERFETAMANQEPASFERYSDPLEMWAIVRVYPSPTGLSVYFRDITERERTEKKLRESEERFRALMEQSPFSMQIFDTEGRVIAVNPAWERLWDAPRDELEDYNILDDEQLEEAGILPHVRDAFDGEVVTLPEVHYDPAEIGKPGRDRWIKGHAYPLSSSEGETSEVVLVHHDITARKEREQELERYENAVETVWDGITVLDADERFVLVNEAFCDLTGYEREEVIGEHATLILDESSYSEAGELHEEVVEGTRDTATLEYDLRTADGGRVPVEARFGPVEYADSTAGGAGVIRDMTDRKERERELEEQRERYHQLTQAAPVSIATYGPEGSLTYVNRAGIDLMGVTEADDLLGESAIEFVHPADRTAAAERMQRVIQEREAVPPKETRVVTPDGEVKHTIVTGVPITHDAAPAAQIVLTDITERKERERTLEESEARFRMLAENLAEMVWISDPDTREILYINPAYEEIWDRDRESLYDDPTTFIEAVHPDDRQRVKQAYASVPDEGFDEEYRIVRPDGDVRWLTVRAAPIRDDGRERVIGIAEDITERKERARALEESEQRYRTLAENFPNGAVGLFDENLEYTAVGGQLLDATGVEPEDRIGSSVADIYPDELVEEVEPYFHAALDGEANSFEAEFHDRHLYAHTLPVRNADDEVFAGMLVVQDVTERREYERRLEASNERLEQFAYAASHDLQEPLRMVSSYLQLIESRYADDLDEDGEEFIDYAVDGADRMRAMIEGLLAYSRVETQGDPFEPVELDAILDDVRANLQVAIEETDAEITAEDLPRVEGDASQLRQVFQNLLDNAIEYSGDEPPRVHVSVERDGAEWIVSVRDDGIGIGPEDAEKVFEVFQRLHSRDEHEGTGLGLALTTRIVERHGGRIWVESGSGEGATFSFTLPVASDRDT